MSRRSYHQWLAIYHGSRNLHRLDGETRCRQLRIEKLEDRRLLTTPGIWQFQGPAPIRNGQVNVPPNYLVTGAVESIAVNPYNSSQIYAGTVNGGVWRTNNANPANPDATVWMPLTDQLPSLAIGDIAFSPLDTTGNTLFAGTGSFSSLASLGGPAVGVLRTTDGGGTWNTFPLTGGGQPRIKVVLPTTIDLDPGAGLQQMILVGTFDSGGLYCSTDNGQSYNLLSGNHGLPNGDIDEVIADPNNGNRFYAGIANQGVFRGDFNPGTATINWTAVNNGISGISTAESIHLAAADSGAITTLYALVPGNTQGAFRSINNGTSWTPLATPPSVFTSNPNTAIVTDPTNDQVIYISAAYNATPDIFRYNPAGSGSWVAIDYSGAQSNTAPHADPRDLVFQGTGTLLQSGDGGIYFIEHPLDAANHAWHAYIGDGGTGLGDVEFHDVAWDSNSKVIVGGSQDNGTEVQQTTGSAVWQWFSSGDGGDVAVDNLTLAASNRSIRYSSSQTLGGFSRRIVDINNNIVSTTNINTSIVTDAQFITPIELNTVNPLRLLIGGSSHVYESMNQGGTITSLGGPGAYAMVYGGRSGGIDNPDLIYLGKDSQVYKRTTAGGAITPTTVLPSGAETITDIAIDTNDWKTVFAIDRNQVFMSLNAGSTWRDITADLSSLGAADFHTIEYVPGVASDSIALGTQSGVYRTRTSSIGVWEKVATGLPNAAVFDLEYNQSDDILVAGTLGRGAWALFNASGKLNNVSIQGQKWNDQNGDAIKEIGEVGLSGWSIYLDGNHNGVYDGFSGDVEPDNYAAGTVLNNVQPFATLTTTTGGSVYSRAPSGNYSSTGTLGFAPAISGGGWSNVGLKVNFASPASFVSIDAISDDSHDLGRFQAFDAGSNLLQTYDTGALGTGVVERMAISRPLADIAYVIATGVSGEIINLDNLQFSAGELTTVTDSDGNYGFADLTPGTYVVREEKRSGWVQEYPSKNEDVDQSQLIGSDQVQAVHSTRSVWQTFTAGQTGQLTGLELSLFATGSGDVTVDILDMSGGQISSAPTLGSATINSSKLGGSPSQLSAGSVTGTFFDFTRANIIVEQGDALAFRVRTDLALPKLFGLRISLSDRYSGGTYLGSSNSDAAFKTFMATTVNGTHILSLGLGQTAKNIDFGNHAVPLIRVENITDGGTLTNGVSTVAFGTAAQGQIGVIKEFLVHNDGAAALNIGALLRPAGYTILQALPSTITAGSSATLRLRLDTQTMGLSIGTISFGTNESFSFNISGSVGAATGQVVYLSDFVNPLDSQHVSNGWGPIELDRSNGETGPNDGRSITLNGQVYDKGIGAHAPTSFWPNAEITVPLDGQYDRFISDVGIDDESEPDGSVVFQVWLDGSLAYEIGPVYSATDIRFFDVPVTGFHELRLKLTDAGDGSFRDHADWANARLIRSPGAASEYNHNGLIDAADYVLWRKMLGAHVTPFTSADGSGNAVVGLEDYDVWRANFGSTTVPSYTMSDARQHLGSMVRIGGVITTTTDLVNDTTLRNFFIQDATGGIVVFGANSVIDLLLTGITEGDSVAVTGPVDSFGGSLEIDATIGSVSLVKNGHPGVPQPISITTSMLSDFSAQAESLEGMLVKLTGVSFTGGGTFSGAQNYTVTDGFTQAIIRVSTTQQDIVGKAIPTGLVDLTGVLSEYDPTVPPPGPGVPGKGYELLLRTLADIVSHAAGAEIGDGASVEGGVGSVEGRVRIEERGASTEAALAEPAAPEPMVQADAKLAARSQLRARALIGTAGQFRHGGFQATSSGTRGRRDAAGVSDSKDIQAQLSPGESSRRPDLRLLSRSGPSSDRWFDAFEERSTDHSDGAAAESSSDALDDAFALLASCI